MVALEWGVGGFPLFYEMSPSNEMSGGGGQGYYKIYWEIQNSDSHTYTKKSSKSPKYQRLMQALLLCLGLGHIRCFVMVWMTIFSLTESCGCFLLSTEAICYLYNTKGVNWPNIMLSFFICPDYDTNRFHCKYRHIGSSLLYTSSCLL